MPKAKCDVCQKRKGKRVCPVRGGGAICPPCCAQNRVTVFDCPPDCTYLGAEGSMRLAEQRSTDLPPASLEQIEAFFPTLTENEPRARLMAEAEPTAVAALAQLAELADPEDEDHGIDSAIWEWIVMGAQAKDGRALVDHIVERIPRRLRQAELAALQALHRTRYALLRIEAYGEDNHVRAIDLLSDRPEEITAPGLQERFPVGRTVGCFVTPTADGPVAMMGAWGVPEDGQQTLLTRLRELHEESELKDVPLPNFLTRLALVIPLLIFEQLRDQISPEDVPPPFL